MNLTLLHCHALRQAAETTGGARESIQIPERCAELCWLFQAYDSYLPAVLLLGEKTSISIFIQVIYSYTAEEQAVAGKVLGVVVAPPSLKRCAASKEEHH